MTDSSNKTQPSEFDRFPLFFEKVWTLSGVIASISILISFIHDWGLYYELGISFAQAPTSISDHVQSWLIWLPSVVVVTFAPLAFEMLSRRIEEGRTETEIINSSSNPSKTKKFRNMPWNVIGVVGLFSLVSWILLGNYSANSFYLGTSICWLLFSRWVFGHPKVSARHSKMFKFCFAIFPLTFIVVFHLGQISARDFSTHYRLYTTELVFTDGLQREYTDVEIIRSFDEWLLVRNSSNSAAWIPINHIDRIELLEQRKPFPGLLCVLSQRFCAIQE